MTGDMAGGGLSREYGIFILPGLRKSPIPYTPPVVVVNPQPAMVAAPQPPVVAAPPAPAAAQPPVPDLVLLQFRKRLLSVYPKLP